MSNDKEVEIFLLRGVNKIDLIHGSNQRFSTDTAKYMKLIYMIGTFSLLQKMY